jgi:leucyl aminopeptidase
MAYDFVREQISGWYASNEQVEIEEDAYQPYSNNPSIIWKNLVLTIPGTQYPEEIVILSAHLDSTSRTSPYSTAPGADDNATGVATLLEAARVLQSHPLPRTVRIIWFTGEEQGLLGSQAYVQDHALENIIGVINLDMFGYNSDEDRCFELHVGGLPASAVPGQCFVHSIDAFDIDLKYDYIINGATSASDHSSFWSEGIGALEVLENYQTNNQPGGCSNTDWNPYYHSPSDTIDHVDLAFGYDVARAGLATFFSLANALPDLLYPYYLPFLTTE